MKRRIWACTGVVLAAAFLFGGTVALGDEEDGGAFAEGVCSEDSEYSIGLVPEVGLALEVEVETEEPHQAWRVKMVYNDGFFVERMHPRTDAEGAFHVRKVVGNSPAVDRLKVKAVNMETGEVCEGSLQAPL
jgi:hypothetical protein